MQRIDGRAVYSASDLNDYLACEHLTMLELGVQRGELQRPDDRPAQAVILSRLGDEHERRYLQRLRDEGVEVVTIERTADRNGDRAAALRTAAEATIAAMHAGAPAIYQATFFDGTWLGHADILRRVEAASGLGAWSYEVEDAKLARSAKPYFLVQLAFYSAFVEGIQGRPPELMHVVLGDGSRHPFRVGDFAPYERYVRRSFLERVPAKMDPTEVPYPYRVAHCGLCVWDARCAERRRSDDKPTEVAGLTRLQERRMSAAGIATLAELGTTPAPPRPAKIEAATFEKLARQARLQFEQREAFAARDPQPYRYELLPIDPEAKAPRGFALLRAPSPGDVFFDMEGDPFYDVADGLEYLFGAYTHDQGFHSFWGCDRRRDAPNDRLAEKRAFEAFIDFVMKRRALDPGMHVYHYADYEKRALQALAQRHATREDEVDVLLREERLVDLLRVVRQSVVVGQPGYGLKKIEALYGGRPSAAISAGDESIVRFEEWRALRDGPQVHTEAQHDAILGEIEAYNEQDCVSTARLRAWLLERRDEATAAFGAAIPFYAGKAADPAVAAPKIDPHADLKRRLEAALPPDFDFASAASATDPARPLALARHLLDYHWREEKPVWWAFFNRCEQFGDNPDVLLDDGEAIVGLEFVGEPVMVKQSKDYEFRFPIQEYKFDDGTAYDPVTKAPTGDIVSVEVRDGHGILILRRGAQRQKLPFPSAVVIRSIYPSKTLQAALARFADALLAGAPRDRRYRAAYDLLTAAAPRLRSAPPGARIQPERANEDTLHALIRDLDDSYLFVQGPPGSGKTYQGAHAIVRLLAGSERVGITANSHKAINNLLREVERVACELGVRFDAQRKVGGDDDTAYVSRLGAETSIRNVDGDFVLGDGGLYAGTVWAFAGPKMDGALDYLFVDEAGQVALPNALAAATCARNLVLLGDPLQLAHVRNTSHPGDLGASVLEHLLGGEMRPVAPDRGVLLDHTYRMHADVCRFISDLMYEGRLHPINECNEQRVDSPGLSGTGVRYIPIDHDDARVRSKEEARAIADEIEKLLRGTVREASGESRPLKPCDIIVVTPYNAQRRCIESELRARGGGCAEVAVGTVDKFQGQEAYVVFFSSAKSSPEETPRGVDFIFDRNRLNVAISRARALAVYVGSPELLHAPATSIARMRALSAGCALIEYGTAPVAAGAR